MGLGVLFVAYKRKKKIEEKSEEGGREIVTETEFMEGIVKFMYSLMQDI